jgi:hypothetical protein
MLDELDEALRRLLVRELPVRNSEIDLVFDQPRREWSARLSRPTLNLYLHDLRENAKLRQSYTQRAQFDVAKQEVQLRRPEVRMDVHYMISAWTTEPEDEHRLLARTLMALLRTPELPDDLLPDGLQNQPRPIALTVAQYESLLNPTDIWSVLDNELRPAISCVCTLTLDPYAPLVVPLVRTRELRMAEDWPLRSGDIQVRSYREERPAGQSRAGNGRGSAIFRRTWTIGGRVPSGVALENARLMVVDQGREVPIAADGSFVIGDLQAGEYTLELTVEGREPIRRTLPVPGPEYDLASSS